MSDRKQTFYYHVGRRNTTDLEVKVILRKVVSGLKKAERPSRQQSSVHNIQANISWQEKILGPCDRIKSYRKTRIVDPKSRIRELRPDSNNECGDLFKDEAFIYTHVDKEFYCLSNTRGNDECLPSSNNAHLVDAMSYLPAHNLHSEDTLNKNSVKVHDRLSREDPFQMMYIVAAADCNVEELNNTLHTQEKTDGPNDLDTRLFHKEILCTMKLYESGLLEVTPGFSNIETEHSDDDHIFVSSESLEKRALKGAKLTTFIFTTSTGSIYQYTLEWVDFLVDQTELESLAIQEMDEHYRQLAQKRKNILERLNENNASADWVTRPGDEELINIELSSAYGFYPQWNHSSLSIDYDITLPKGWKCLIDDYTPENESTHIGSTRLSKPTCQSTHEKSTRLNLFFCFVLFQLVIVYDANLVTVLLLLVGIRFAFERIFGQSGIHNPSFEHGSYLFGHQLSIHRVEDVQLDEDAVNQNETEIKLFLRVCAISDNGMKTVLGYGSLSIPTRRGSYDFNIQTCKLIASRSAWSEIIYRMNDYYFGCTMSNFSKVKNYFMNPHQGTSDKRPRSLQMSNNEIVTEASGTVQTKVQVLSRSASHKSRINGNDRVRHMLDEVLSKVRRHKRSLHQSTNKHVPTTREDSLNQATKELLSRVKARKRVRQNQR